MRADSPTAASAVQRTLTGFCVLVAAAHIIGGLVSTPSLWGFDHWAFVSPAAFLAASLILIGLFTPWGQAAGARALRPLAELAGDPKRCRFLAAGAIGVIVVFFWFGRERTFFLSDGELLIRSIETGNLKSFEADLLSFHFQVWARRVARDVLHISSMTASFRAISIVAGIVWLAAMFAAVGQLVSAGWQRLLLCGVIATLGLTRFFYGYVETSPLLAAASAVFIWRSVVFLKTGRGLFWMSAALLVAIAMHVTGVLLVPCYLYAVIVARRQGFKAPVLTLAAAGTLVLAVFWTRSGSLQTLPGVGSSYFSKFVPLAGPLGPKQAYTFFSSQHLNDFLQQQILLGPFALPLLVVLGVLLWRRKRGESSAPPGIAKNGTIPGFLLLAFLPVVLLGFLYSRELGAARDWDLLSGVAPAAILAALLLIGSLPAPALPRATVLVLATALFHLVPWVLVDTSPARSLARFAALLSPGAPISRFARAYGCEEIGRYHLERGDLASARTWFEKAAVIDPSDVKALGPLAEIYRRSGDRPAAIAWYTTATSSRPDVAALHHGLGDLLSEENRHHEAILAYRSGLRIEPDNADAWERLGHACFAAGNLAAADSAWETAARLGPSPDLWYNRGLIRERKGDLDGAIAFYEKVVAIEPAHAAAHFSIGAAHLGSGRPAEALPWLQKAHTLSPSIASGINLALALAFTGHAAEVRHTLSGLPLDEQVMHAWKDAGMVLAGQGQSEAALELLQDAAARNPSLASSCGVMKAMEEVERSRGSR